MPMPKQPNGQNFILSEEIYNQVNKILEALATKTRAELVVFCDTNGYPVSHVGDKPNVDLWAISSLAANNFSATAEMAAMVGEKESFKFLFHEGEKNNIYLSAVQYDFILMLIFEADVAIGMVRIFTNKAIDALNQLLETARREEQTSKDFVDLEFKNLLGEEIDRSFKL